MDSEKPNFHTTKLLTTWWDLVDHYVLAVMLAVSVASVGLQTTQDRLICIPAVRCSDFASNDSVVRRWKEYRDVLDTCDQSSSSVVLTKMSDRRQYDYIDNECFKKLHWFSAYYSLIFLGETVILLAISNFWQKYSNSASALAHCENLLSEFIKGDILVSAGDETQRRQQQPQNQQQEQQEQQQQQQQQEQQQQQQKEQNLLKRLKVFEKCYSDENTSSVTLQYRLRGVVGIISTMLFLGINIGIYFTSAWSTQCQLDGHVTFATQHRFFQCTRSMETYFDIVSILLIVLLVFHLVFVFVSVKWSFAGQRRKPEYKIIHELRPILEYKGDAAFLFHFINQANYSFVITVISHLYEKDQTG
ncbi:volume-regulated anion channel subunit LRRC8A-like [Acropora millepora]|uniref:volume-regulated anion channel subunit LRRC8A-like n=1 Tax=Acropora millepora TaxID=45264 RepID=UPI001CF1296D|nr:volume-regulated anion channel subunit LRRC8A-like [Acropora millepora]XP_029195289.2 volume-regulated anion channel subunit LRRC8A-like [Acropora millepora]XP_044166418.1 volume-regulated anion channel subunit LRRC8A-like [Acropora millepora]